MLNCFLIWISAGDYRTEQIFLGQSHIKISLLSKLPTLELVPCFVFPLGVGVADIRVGVVTGLLWK